MTKPCLTCGTRHNEPGPYCRPHYLERQRARNNARKGLYGGTWRATSKRARKAQPWCSVCGKTYRLSLDHEHGQVECQSCNSSHRREPNA